MLRTVTLLVAVSLASHASAAELIGTTHIDYRLENSEFTFCCDGAAIFSLDHEPGSVHFDYFSILDHTNNPVWTVSDFDVDFNGLSAGLRISQSGNWLQIDNFPGFETTINPDTGSGYTEFGPTFIELPSLSVVSVPEPSAFVLLLGSMAFLLKR